MEPTGFICSSGLSIDFVISLGVGFHYKFNNRNKKYENENIKSNDCRCLWTDDVLAIGIQWPNGQSGVQPFGRYGDKATASRAQDVSSCSA